MLTGSDNTEAPDETGTAKVLAKIRCEARRTSGLRTVCAELGLDPARARLLRNVNNAVFQLARDPVVIRLVTLPSQKLETQQLLHASHANRDHLI